MAYTEKQKKRIPELILDMAERACHKFKQGGVDEKTAEELSWEFAREVGESWGGINLYISKGYQISKHKRDLQIYTEFDGANHAELARKYGMSEQWIYRIIRQVRQDYIDERQSELDI